ncbi:hypothetical protein ASG37_05060 [Sphingomonas sp. Leaf407]|uniref:helix-turn-helix domain-containing protein n=1 Tax=unclassified Sphingomonas TaxID=196159 RepID=UPI0006F54CD4|nr:MULTISPECIES: helix-turn-helix domain-containing protein [unclassified Sphingomonas]KQN37032.1 hypothetical protein ASE97_10975 [Sphingomonas sp. Leaf42]KQT30459.1 hypothetical protein ASG37_05060 [Sphingomonas sp. Leaf407]
MRIAESFREAPVMTYHRNLVQCRLFNTLSSIAEAGEPCPTNDGLAERLGCDPRAVARAFTELREQALIAVEPARTQRRVTIVASGKSTAVIVPAKRIRSRRKVSI